MKASFLHLTMFACVLLGMTACGGDTDGIAIQDADNNDSIFATGTTKELAEGRRVVFDGARDITSTADGEVFYVMRADDETTEVLGLPVIDGRGLCLVAASELQRYKRPLGLLSTTIISLERVDDACLLAASPTDILAHVLPADAVATSGEPYYITKDNHVMMVVHEVYENEEAGAVVYMMRVSPELNQEAELGGTHLWRGRGLLVLASELGDAVYTAGDVVCMTIVSLESRAGLFFEDLESVTALAHVRPC